MRKRIESSPLSVKGFRRAYGLAMAVLFLFGTSALGGTHPSLVTQPVNNNQRVTLKGNIHPLARPRYDYGLAPDTLPMNRMLLVLKRSPQQETALDNLLVAQQEKKSSQYHHWLTPEQFGKQFGPSDSDLQAVTNWLTSEGFVVNHISNGRTVIEFSGSAGLVRKALHAEIHKYVIKGKSYYANSTNPQIPAALAPVVKGIASLNNFPRKPDDRIVGLFSRSKKTGKIKSLYTITCPQGYTCSGSNLYGIGPTDFATIYNVLPLWNAGINGTGETIAIVSDSNINPQDVANFRSTFGLPANPVNVILDGPDPGLVPGPETEADADTEWTGAVAPDAKIDLVVSEDTEATAGVDLSALYIVDNDLAPVLSESYGACEADLGNAGNAFESDMWEQAAAEGITVLVASGDAGSAGCDDPSTEDWATQGLAVSGTASTPFNVAVGGTDFDNPSSYFSTTNNSTTQDSAKSYIPEITWNDSCASAGTLSDCSSASTYSIFAAGGGPSNCSVQDSSGVCTAGYAKPPWQTGTGVPADGLRDTPDVSLFAADGLNGAFYIICSSDSSGLTGGTGDCSSSLSTLDFVGVGGTSLSTPAFAGIMALVNQKTGQRQGNANFVLYPLAAAAAKNNDDCTSDSAAVTDSSCIFYDIVHGHDSSGNLITPGNNSVSCTKGTPDCVAPSNSAIGILVYPSNSSTPAWNTSTGYDPASGLGSVNVTNMVNSWNSISFNSSGTKLTLSPTTLTHGQSVTAGITVTSAAGTPTGDVELMGNPVTTANPNGSNIGLATFTLGSGGTVSGTTNLLPGGTYKVYAHYAGDGTSGSSDSSPIQVTVNPESSNTELRLMTFDPSTGQILNSNVSTLAYGTSNMLLRADVLNSAGDACTSTNTPQMTCPTGSVTLTSNGKSIGKGTYSLNSLGYAEDQSVQQFAVGSYTLVASYSGDNSYKASTSPNDNITVTKAPSTTSMGGSTTVTAGSSLTLVIQVSTQSYGAAPTGTVQVYNGSTPVGSPANCGGFAANGTMTASCTANVTITVNSAETLTTQYSGDANYAASTSASKTISVLIPTTTTLTVSPSGQVAAGTKVTLTAVVTSSQNGGPAPTGDIIFTSDQAPVIGTPTFVGTAGTSTTPATLTATLVTSFNTWVKVTAHFFQDSYYAGSVSSPVTVEEGPKPDFSISVSPSSSTISPGGSATYTMTVAPVAGFSSGISLACSGAPSKATCTVSPSAINLNGTNSETATVKVTTTAPSLLPPGPQDGPPPPGGFAFHEWWIALLLMMMLGALAVISRRRRVPLLAGAVLLAALAMSCGGGGGGGSTTSSTPGTPAGTYTITVTGTSGSLSHSTTMTLVVQ